MSVLRGRLPEFQAILQVYAVIAAMLAGWTITAFLWKLSAWLLLLNIGEILTIFAYAMTANFVESLTVLSFLLAACLFLPAGVLRDDFVVRGTLLSVGLIGSLMVFTGSQMQLGMGAGLLLLIAPLAVLSQMGYLLYSVSRLQRVRSLAIWFSDRLIVFLFLLLPLFALSLLYVLLRNAA